MIDRVGGYRQPPLEEVHHPEEGRFHDGAAIRWQKLSSKTSTPKRGWVSLHSGHQACPKNHISHSRGSPPADRIETVQRAKRGSDDTRDPTVGD